MEKVILETWNEMTLENRKSLVGETYSDYSIPPCVECGKPRGLNDENLCKDCK